MRGAAYGLTLIVILLVTNLCLYLYGVNIPAGTWFGTGIATRTTESEIIPSGEVSGSLQYSGLENLIRSLLASVVIGIVVGIVVGWVLQGGTAMTYIIPAAIIGSMFMFFFSPMGTIIAGDTGDVEGMYCYSMQSVTMFNKNLAESSVGCVPPIVHTILVIFFSVLMVATFISFIRGAEW